MKIFLNSLSRPNQKRQQPSFDGHALVKDSRGRDLYKFFLPNAPKNSTLNLAVMTVDKNNNYQLKRNTNVTLPMPEGHGSVSVYASKLNLNKDNFLVYKFNIDGSEYTDKGRHFKFGDDFYSVAIPLSNANNSKPRQMGHVLIDSFNVENPEKSSKRMHFNIMGGTLNSLSEKIDSLKDFGIRNILGTPIFGQDNKSSHGYWTTNAYQITKNLGSHEDFRKLMIKLYQNGMSWTADGAFVNEGAEGIHIKDIMNWGANSPFMNMFETKDLKNVNVRFGVFSKNEDVNKHLHIKLVNAPYKINYQKTEDGYKQKSITKNKVDATKPTYIQVFDDRLVSEEQANGNFIFDVYDKKSPKNKYDIASSKDSAQAYHFRVEPSEVENNYEKYLENKKHNEHALLEDYLRNWNEFSLVNSNKDGGVSLWVGNNDISKKRFVVSEYSLQNEKLSPDKKKEMMAAPYQVQDDVVQIGKFWTADVSNMLAEYTAKELYNRASKYFDNNDVKTSYKLAINELVEEKLLPDDAKEIFETVNSKTSAFENILSISPVNNERKYSLKTPNLYENVTEGLMSYPLDAIEFSADLMGVIAYPYIKNLAVSSDTVGLSRFDMYNDFDNYSKLMPNEYVDTYRKMDSLYANEMTSKAKEILRTLEDKTGKTLFDGDDLTDLGKEFYSFVANDIAKFLVVSSLAPKIKPMNNLDALEYDVDELASVDLNKLNLQYENSPQKVADRLISKIQKGLNNIPADSMNFFLDNLENRLNSMNSDSINLAKLILEKSELGLSWRIDAAKDTGDWDADLASRITRADNEASIYAFWNKFNNAVRKHNSKTYTVGEITDWTIDKFNFLTKTGFTAMSDYDYFYSFLQKIYGQDDHGVHEDNYTDNFYTQLDNFLESVLVDNSNYSHRFVGNHDKPRILHQLAINVAGFNKDKGQEIQRVIEKGFNSSDEFNNLSFDNKKSIFIALDNLKKGSYTVDGKNTRFDSEDFGTRAFDLTIEDAVNEAMLLSKDFNSFAKKNPEKIKRLKAQTLRGILEPAMSKYRSMLFAMVALPGSPTHFAGDELGMTGWETFCKNEKQDNRNALRFDWLSNDDYKFVKNYSEILSHVMNIRNDKAASALVNGTLQPLEKQKMTNGGDAVAFYRYNDKTDAIAVLHGCGYGNMPEHKGIDCSLNSIRLGGLKNGLQVGTIYVNALNKNEKFKVVNPYEIKKISSNGYVEDYIDLGNSGIILLRENDFNNKQISFSGNKTNSFVKLHNTKFVL